MRHLIIMIVAMFGIVAPVQSPSTDDPAAIPEAVELWFTEKAQATVRSYSSDVFPDFTSDEVSTFTVGTPELTSEMVRGLTPDTAIRPSARWIAPIMNGDTAVGALSVNIADGVAGEEIVSGDARLGSAIARDEDDVRFVWDSELSAWFIQRGTAIELGDAAAAKIILGSVPIDDFLAQRDRILSGAEPVPQAPEDPARPVETEPPNVPFTLALVLGVLAILVGSLVWLRSEQTTDIEDDEAATDELASVERKGVVGTRASKMKYRDSGRKVNVYRTKKPKDDSGLLDD